LKKSFRLSLISLFFSLIAFIVIARLFYWQAIASEKLTALSLSQRETFIEIPATRGQILANDNFPLVTNRDAFLLYANLEKLEKDSKEIAKELASILIDEIKEASDGAKLEEKRKKLLKKKEEKLSDQLSQDLVWVALEHKISEEQKSQIDKLNIKGLGFELEQERFYPEASMAAHLLGFVGKNSAGKDIGYFGVEGYYELELAGRGGILKEERDATKKPILIGSFLNQEKRDGRNLVLHIDRAIQFAVEESLKKAIEKYEAKKGSVVVLNPQNGAVLAMASHPPYIPDEFEEYEEIIFKNPIIADLYEPGSTFKVLTMAAAIEEDLVTPETRCDICNGPFKIDKYEIKTWNDKYHPDSTMTEVLQHSDNIGMVFVGNKLGIEKFVDFLKKFGIDKKTGIDLQEEMTPSIRDYWSEVDLATAAFGQGISITPIQMAAAVAAIANEGRLMQPQLVKKIFNREREVNLKPKEIGRPISKETAKTLTEMMVSAVEYGEAKWAKPEGYKIAGKTGTAQVAIAGHYDEKKTIASFVGFAPADNPRFLILTKLDNPGSSPWASETAAPLFFNIAKKLFLYFGIPPTS